MRCGTCSTSESAKVFRSEDYSRCIIWRIVFCLLLFFVLRFVRRTFCLLRIEDVTETRICPWGVRRGAEDSESLFYDVLCFALMPDCFSSLDGEVSGRRG